MKDGVIKGEGNSRKIMASQAIAGMDFDQFRQLLLTDGLLIDLLINEPGWTSLGTLLNKANLLTDATAAELGLDPSNDPSLNDAFLALGQVAGMGGGISAINANGTNTYIAEKEKYTEYVTGSIFAVYFTNGNTTASTLNINGLGAKSITRVTVALTSGDIAAGSLHFLYYDGTRFQLITQGSRLTAAQLVSAITGYALGADSAILATDSIVGAFGKAQGQINARISLVSAISGYVAGSNTALASTDSLLAALGKIQGQITARASLTGAITGYTVGTNTALAATDTLVAALGKLQGQMNARLTTSIKSRQVGSVTNTTSINSSNYISITSVDVNKSIGVIIIDGAASGTAPWGGTTAAPVFAAGGNPIYSATSLYVFPRPTVPLQGTVVASGEIRAWYQVYEFY